MQIQRSLHHLSPHFTAWSMWSLEGAIFPRILQTNNGVCLNWRVERESAVSTIYSLASSFGIGHWWRWVCLQSLEYCCSGCSSRVCPVGPAGCCGLCRGHAPLLALWCAAPLLAAVSWSTLCLGSPIFLGLGLFSFGQKCNWVCHGISHKSFFIWDKLIA